MEAQHDRTGPARTNPLVVVADDREPCPGVVDALRAMPGIEVRVERLPAGDYHVDGRLLVERKSLRDFAASLVDGRLFKQAVRLARAGSGRVALVLEGRGADLAQTGVSREALQGALISISVVLGIPVLRALDTEETARLIVYAAGQLRREAAGALPRAGWRPKGKRARQLYVLQGVPKIGPARAASLLNAFGSIEGVFTADESDLASLPGIGPSTAKAIRWIAREPGIAYVTRSRRRPRTPAPERTGNPPATR
jgi:ERCC4-type nuclease